MRLIYFSTAPFIGVGYGVTSRALVPRMKADGHEVKIATKHHLGGQIVIEGMECFDGGELNVVNAVAKKEGYDYILSGNDLWAFSAFNALGKIDKELLAACIYLDTEWIHPHMINAAKECKFQIAVTRHGERELKRVGFNPIYAPLGVDTKLFRPDPELRKEFRKRKNWEDNTFVIGFVGINYKTDRKNIVGLLKAFQKFHNEFPKSILYLHTDIFGSTAEGLPLNWIMNACGFDPEGKGAVHIVDQTSYHLWNISQDELVGLYNAFDVFCFPTQGEGFGLPLVEAQACGCPIITTETTSGAELCKGGLLIHADENYYEFSTLKTWFLKVPMLEIYKKLKIMHKIWDAGKMGKYQKAAREGMLEYDWDVVYDKYWRPLLKTLEEAKRPTALRTMQPDWRYLHNVMNGRMTFQGKGDCGQFGCKDVCNYEFKHFKTETKDDRPVLSKSYPIFSNKEGKLVVDIRCGLSKWLTPRFIEEVALLWKELWSFPRIREEVIELWDSGYFDEKHFVPLESINHDFDETYAKIMQTGYYTIFSLTDEIVDLLKPYGNKVLDVGCGDGKRVKELREKGFDAIGAEINSNWVDNEIIVKGDAYNLPFEDTSFDVVMCIDVLEHLKDPLLALKELFRVTKKVVLLQVTTPIDISFKEDATHCVDWSPIQWEREVSEFGIIKQRMVNKQTWLIEKI